VAGPRRPGHPAWHRGVAHFPDIGGGLTVAVLVNDVLRGPRPSATPPLDSSETGVARQCKASALADLAAPAQCDSGIVDLSFPNPGGHEQKVIAQQQRRRQQQRECHPGREVAAALVGEVLAAYGYWPSWTQVLLLPSAAATSAAATAATPAANVTTYHYHHTCNSYHCCTTSTSGSCNCGCHCRYCWLPLSSLSLHSFVHLWVPAARAFDVQVPVRVASDVARLAAEG